jgi:hypothetical protein
MEGEETASPVLHRLFDTQRLPPKKAVRMGDKAKPLAAKPRWRLCCLICRLMACTLKAG